MSLTMGSGRVNLVVLGFMLMLVVAPLALAQAQNETATEHNGGLKDPSQLTIEDWFADASMSSVALSPDGELVAFLTKEDLQVGTPDGGFSSLEDFGREEGWSNVRWIGPKTLSVERRLRTAYLYAFLGIEAKEGRWVLARSSMIMEPGYIVDPLTKLDEQILFAKVVPENDLPASNVFKLNVFDELGGQLRPEKKLNYFTGEILYWMTDSRGRLTVGVSRKDGVPALWENRDGRRAWTKLWTAPKEQEFIPLRVSDDGKTLWALTDIDSNTMVAVEFDLVEARQRRVLYENAAFDVSTLLFVDGQEAPVAAGYLRGGLLHYEPLSDEGRREVERLKAGFSGLEVHLVDYHAQSGAALLNVHPTAAPGAIYACSAPGECDRLGLEMPGLDGYELAETALLPVDRGSERPLEAFLTLPVKRAASIPLVIFPHGGPIGVQDDRYFSPYVQWLAAAGYAVLQVNYRGSSGYGSTFQEQGLQQFGRAIEDDIEAAVEASLVAEPTLDSDRIVVFGSSYGGYSALMGVIRNPARYRCAASFAGVSDLHLMFTQAATRYDASLREAFIEIIGDPEMQRESLIEHSPVYRFRDIVRPVLLIHGTEDPIVDVEHSWRLYKMLELASADVELNIIDGLGHSPTPSQAQQVLGPVLPFFETCLAGEQTSAQQPAPAEAP
ncbi:MAG: alpha/beta fold hydrolase [Pseudomonadota bacterium]